MRTEQKLASGLVIRQDIAEAVRLPLFPADTPEVPVWTHGGAVVLVSYQGKVYGLTCKHIVGNDHALWTSLLVPASKRGGIAVLVQACRTARAAWGHVASTDIEDLAVLRFDQVVNADWFEGKTYVIDPNTICRSNVGDDLVVHGTLKDRTSTILGNAETTYCHIGFSDRGNQLTDHSLRTCTAEPHSLDGLASLNGVSGGAVFNITQNALCGIATRAGLAGLRATLHYVDIHHALKLLQAVHSGTFSVSYKMTQEAFLLRA